MKPWYAYYTRSRAEKAALARLQQQGIDAFLPLYTVEKQWSDRKKRVEEPLIRGYIFARPDSHQYHTVLNTFGIVSCLWYDGKPALIPDAQIEVLRQVMKEKMEIEPAPALLFPGQLVTVLGGPLKGREAELVQMAGKHKIVIRIDHIDKSLLVAISPQMVKPIARIAHTT